MALLVQKFGGTSLADMHRLQCVADIIIKAKQAGHDIAVVVSAMSGETDRLINLAKSVTTNGMQHEPAAREYAALVSTGENVSMSLLAMALEARGVEAQSFNGAQASIITDSKYRSARITKINQQPLQQAISAGKVAIIAGFQGVNANGEITTLGRGGSDTSAVAVAAALNAKECQIYTDVEGVYTADPRIVPQSRCISHLTFEEMLEFASLGAKVIQVRAVEFACKYNIPLRVLSSFLEHPGTLITDEEIVMEQPLVSGVTYNKTEARVSLMAVPNQPGIAAKILAPISDAGVDVDMIVQNTSHDACTDFTLTVHKDDYQQTMQILDEVAPAIGAKQVIGDPNVAKLSIIGVGMRGHAGVASKMFTTLANEGINIHLIATSEIKVSVVVDEKYLELGVRALHTAFELAGEGCEEEEK